MTGAWREVGDRAWVRRYEALDQTIGVVGGADGLASSNSLSKSALYTE